MAQKVLAVIPARMSSKRFSGKVTYPYQGKPLLFYTYHELQRAKQIDRLVIATDNSKIKKIAEDFGAEVIITSSRHKTGSDRVAEVMKKIGGDIIINIQADNFGLKASVLDKTIKKIKNDRKINFATLIYRIENDDELFNPNKVKVLVNGSGNALWFSRFPLPYLQNCREKNYNRQYIYWGHIGVYFFRHQALNRFADWKRTSLEKAESLEQLRIIENGEKIKVFKTKMRSISVDSPRDLKKINDLYK